MWKATATLDKKQLVHITPSKDEDWDSDPDFVNEISEKDQRWGKQKTIQENPKSNPVEMNELRQQVVSAHEKSSSQEWAKKANATKKSYGAVKE